MNNDLDQSELLVAREHELVHTYEIGAMGQEIHMRTTFLAFCDPPNQPDDF
jgi:hypothetical protein